MRAEDRDRRARLFGSLGSQQSSSCGVDIFARELAAGELPLLATIRVVGEEPLFLILFEMPGADTVMADDAMQKAGLGEAVPGTPPGVSAARAEEIDGRTAFSVFGALPEIPTVLSFSTVPPEPSSNSSPPSLIRYRRSESWDKGAIAERSIYQVCPRNDLTALDAESPDFMLAQSPSTANVRGSAVVGRPWFEVVGDHCDCTDFQCEDGQAENYRNPWHSLRFEARSGNLLR